MDIRIKATEFIDYLQTNHVITITHDTLRAACCEFFNTYNTKLIIDYLIETGLITPIVYQPRPDYTINYNRNEQLKDPEFNWLKTEGA